ncbi:hypothetical protein LLH06_08230 [Mucilaginibacter daejeonensis]|uniref:hypothetical protein n=1 Tax=Mucilaginibacter daejeonensis TaxID=398049 RepID=UPI001D17AF0F|nr:hypothetical protein [Mucilaginibacter daejeonensis]UEG54950.1 hypothetical protein LLH06_08230 [Mucilaginibacter daejeonensis]
MLILAFVAQDLVLLALINTNQIGLVFPVIAAKEALIAIYLGAIIFFTRKFKIDFFLNSKYELQLWFLLIIVALLYVIIGLGTFPATGVLYEGRAIFMPLILYLLGGIMGHYFNKDSLYLHKVVKCIETATIILALSAIIDYFFLPVSFWENIKAGSLDTIKGGFTSSGSLPDNFFSVFGRRALGLAINPLLLSYLLIPGLSFFLSKKKYLFALLTFSAMVLSFSRLPVLAVLISYGVFKTRSYVKVVLVVALFLLLIRYFDRIVFIFSDASAVGHYSTFTTGLDYFLNNPLGYGVGSAGVFAFNYSDMYAESAVLNLLNQIGILGFLLYVGVISFGLFNKRTAFKNEMMFMSSAYFITAFLSPQIFVIKASFLFFILLGINNKSISSA